ATLFFIVIFLAFMFYGLKGGVIAALLAIAGYIGLRYDDIQAVGAGTFTGLIASRAVAFLAFGAIGGWANEQLEGALEKLEIYDQIDDATGLFNARFFLQDTDLEKSRSERYQTIFSVAVCDIPVEAIENVDRRKRKTLLRDLGTMLKDSLRSVDRATHGRTSTRHRLAIVLPETGPEGAQIFADRLVERVGKYVGERGAGDAGGAVKGFAVTYPGDEEALRSLRAEFVEIDRLEHPENAES
ncbi:MAG: two-component system, cell cycle response regulator, partial [Actinomycetota bacterium]|nr:two-component system, cell cycle response regulator [Actinomycetota bacterium]